MENNKQHHEVSPTVTMARRTFIVADDVIHIVVAAMLVAAAVLMIWFALKNFRHLSIASILLVVNDALFVLIIAEVLWTIIRYLRREQFSLAPFLFIGIISSLRRILFIDAQMAIGESERSFYENLMELGAHVAIIFVLVVAYFLVRKARTLKE